MNEERIHRQYAEPFQFSPHNFLNMISLDAVFIIELFLRFRHEHRGDFLLNEVWLRAIRRDLLLLENQVPYFVIEGLYYLAFTTTSDQEVSYGLTTFSTLAVDFFQLNRFNNTPLSRQRPDVKINHFTDLCRYALVEIPENPKFPVPITSRNNLPNAVKLKNSGVNFKSSSGYLVDIQLEKRKTPMPLLNEVELKIPCFEITDNTESWIRNVMALEQCHYPGETYICSYIHLMDSLIDSEHDVDLLEEKGIILNFMGNDTVIADMFNQLCRQIPSSSTYYFGISYQLKEHYRSKVNHAMATLKNVYFSNPWRSTATVVAIILLLLTLTQTLISIVQVAKKI